MSRCSVRLTLILLLVLCLLPGPFSSARAEETMRLAPRTGSNTYGDYHDCAEVRQHMTTGWYTVFEDITISEKVTISGDVNIILRDGLTFTANDGIRVPQGSRLTLWRINGWEAGLVAKSHTGGAGIGGLDNEIAGEIVIYGGFIEARGADGAAGIGGGSGDGAGVTSITIGGYGRINARGVGGGAGIGGGKNNSHVGPIVINGNNITAEGGSGIAQVSDGGAGIGGGADRSANKIEIHGGSVSATGGDGAAGIGGGDEGTGGEIIITGGFVKGFGKSGGAGIGGGDGKTCGTVTIAGGEVHSYGSSGSAGIGSGSDGDFEGTVKISGGIVEAVGDNGGAGIGAGDCGNCTEGSSVTISGGSVQAFGWNGGAGIGGGDESIWGVGGEGTNVTVTGGYIDARAMGSGDHAIGAGGSDSVTRGISLPHDYKVEASDDITLLVLRPVAERENACHNYRFAQISGCGHPDEPTYYSIDRQHHMQESCPWCGHAYAGELHTFDTDGICTRCGYDGKMQTVRFAGRRPDCEIIISGQMPDARAVPNFPYTLPEPEGIEPYARDYSDYRFSGWSAEGMNPVNTDDLQQSGIYAPGTVVLLPAAESGTFVIYAEWHQVGYISFDANGGTGNMEQAEWPMDGEYPLPGNGFTEPEWCGFLGWQVGDDAENLKQPGETFTVNGNTTVKAVWKRDSYTVTFDANGGSEVEAQSIQRGETATRPADPVREGYVFGGWKLEGALYEFNTPATGDITLLASWKNPWTLLQEEIESTESSVITLTRDVTAEPQQSALLIPEGRTVTIDLNGHSVDRARTAREEDGCVLIVKGSLTLRGEGEITGGCNSSGTGGGVFVDGGAFTMDGGTITGNTADGSDSNAYGGGVYVWNGGTFTMNGGEIRGNRAANGLLSTRQGGGAYIAYGRFTMKGGAITGNTADGEGGGVYIAGSSNHMFHVSGSPVIRNNSAGGQGDNLCLPENQAIVIDGPLDSTASIAVHAGAEAAFTEGLSGNGTEQNFLGDRDNLLILIGEDGEARLEEGLVAEFRLDGEEWMRQIVRVGDRVVQPDDLTDGGRAFLGWYRQLGTDTLSAEPFDFSTVLTEDVVLQAVWETVDFGEADFTLPDGIRLVEEYAFQGIDATAVYIPDGCEEIEPFSFKDCKSLTRIRIPAGCAIGEFSFDGCEHVYVFGTPGGGAAQYCRYHDNCTFVQEKR